MRMSPFMERAAASVLVRSWGRPSGIEDLLEEAIQEAWSVLFREDAAQLRRWSPDTGPLAPYLKQFARNSALNVLSKRRRRSQREADDVAEERPAPQTSAETRVEHLQLAERLFDGLSERDMLAAVAYFVEGSTADELAERFGFTSGHAVHQWALRMRQKLRRRLEKLDD
ncbi:MAG: sigma-70 family RNA polymerase sigma factor [Myxococcota bacterium]